jgi:soluble cytochrome b562
MKKVLSLFLALAVLTPVLPSLHAQESGKKETELETAMGKMNGAFRKLRRQITDASKNADSLDQIAKLRAAADESTKLIPALAAEKPEAERPAFIAAYKKHMQEFLAALAPLEAALKANNNGEAEKLVGQLKDMQTKGHKAYKKPDEKKS